MFEIGFDEFFRFNAQNDLCKSVIIYSFGAQRVSTSTGIVLNDEMDDFSSPNTTNAFGYPPSPSNYIEPGKRPQSSMSPLVIFNETDGQVG